MEHLLHAFLSSSTTLPISHYIPATLAFFLFLDYLKFIPSRGLCSCGFLSGMWWPQLAPWTSSHPSFLSSESPLQIGLSWPSYWMHSTLPLSHSLPHSPIFFLIALGSINNYLLFLFCLFIIHFPHPHKSPWGQGFCLLSSLVYP